MVHAHAAADLMRIQQIAGSPWNAGDKTVSSLQRLIPTSFSDESNTVRVLQGQQNTTLISLAGGGNHFHTLLFKSACFSNLNHRLRTGTLDMVNTSNITGKKRIWSDMKSNRLTVSLSLQHITCSLLRHVQILLICIVHYSLCTVWQRIDGVCPDCWSN